MTTYFVSSMIGSDKNAGTSASAPLATLQAAEGLVKAGDTVEIMNGTYTGSPGGNLLDIKTSGTSGSPITFEAAPGQTPVLNTSGMWNGILVQASYNIIQGLTIVGDAANYTLAQAEALYGISNPNVDGNGIVVETSGGGEVPNHITIQNNTVYDEPGGGIGSIGADYLQILNNTVHDNAHWSAYGNSGISIASSVNSNTNPGIHDVVSGNTSYNNTELVPYYWAGYITDGEGIILDTNTGFTGEILVQGNTAYGNSGAGIESYLTNNAVINGNTAYANLSNPLAASDGQIFINQSTNDVVTNNTTVGPACFLTSTHIATPRGEVPVEQLVAGDTLITNSGATQPIVWVGHRRVDCRRHPDPKQVWPICVSAGAFSPGQPLRDLFLSPEHAMFVDGVLIPIRYLMNGRTIRQEMRDEFTYWHVELVEHDVLRAEGVPVESYLDTGNRGAFDNGGPLIDLHPDFARRIWETHGCAPLVANGQHVAAAKRRLLVRATALGHRTTDEPGLRVLVNGRKLSVVRDGQTWRVQLPRTTGSVRLVSHVWTPAHMRPDSDDFRALGVAISRLWLDGCEVPTDTAALSAGWHRPEPGWRWTNGDALIATPGARELAFKVAMTGTYWRGDERERAARQAGYGEPLNPAQESRSENSPRRHRAG